MVNHVMKLHAVKFENVVIQISICLERKSMIPRTDINVRQMKSDFIKNVVYFVIQLHVVLRRFARMQIVMDI